jgi:fibronectin type 3 domain-containing protein
MTPLKDGKKILKIFSVKNVEKSAKLRKNTIITSNFTNTISTMWSKNIATDAVNIFQRDYFKDTWRKYIMPRKVLLT